MRKYPHLNASFVMQGKTVDNICACFIVANDFNVASISPETSDNFVECAYPDMSQKCAACTSMITRLAVSSIRKARVKRSTDAKNIWPVMI